MNKSSYQQYHYFEHRTSEIIQFKLSACITLSFPHVHPLFWLYNMCGHYLENKANAIIIKSPYYQHHYSEHINSTINKVVHALLWAQNREQVQPAQTHYPILTHPWRSLPCADPSEEYLVVQGNLLTLEVLYRYFIIWPRLLRRRYTSLMQTQSGLLQVWPANKTC